MTLKETLTRNIGWKIGGLVLAIGLWFHLVTEKVYEKAFSAEVVSVGLANNLVIENIKPEMTKIAFTGTGKQLIRLALTDQLKLRIDLSNIEKPGIYEHKFSLLDLYPIDPSIFLRITFQGNDRCQISVKSMT